MNDLQIFRSREFGTIRTLTEPDGKVLFCGSDAAKALGYTNPRKALSDHCKGVTKRYTLTAGGNQELNFIPEGDLYRLAAKSDLPGAERFESWVFDEVLPQIRQTGSYSPALPKDYISALECLVAAEKEKLALAERVEQDRPYVQFGRTVEISGNAVKLEVFAKAVQNTYRGLGRNKLFAILREKHILYQTGGENLPLQEYISRGYFVLKENTYLRGGEVRTGYTPLITGKGQIFLSRKLGEWLSHQMEIA